MKYGYPVDIRPKRVYTCTFTNMLKTHKVHMHGMTHIYTRGQVKLHLYCKIIKILKDMVNLFW